MVDNGRRCMVGLGVGEAEGERSKSVSLAVGPVREWRNFGLLRLVTTRRRRKQSWTHVQRHLFLMTWT